MFAKHADHDIYDLLKTWYFFVRKKRVLFGIRHVSRSSGAAV